jgi:hypothetical protein
MTKISVYNIDEYVTADDKWIGTDVNTYNKTKNFTPRKLSHYFNNNQVINTGVDLLYKYFTITPPETRPTGTLSFETEIGPTVNFSAISTFLLSNTTLKGNYIVEFFDFLVGTNVLMYKAKNINLFGSYKILSVEEYLPEPNFLVVNIEFIEGNGFIEEDEDYMISLIDISSGGGGSQNLQQVTDEGSTTTNPITAASFIKQGGTGTNILLDNGNTVSLSSIGGNTNLSTTQTASNFTINSDTGTDASVPLGNGTLAGATLNDYTTAEKNKLGGIAPGANVGVVPNSPITGATKTKITYDSKGLVTAGVDATTADITDSTNKRYVTDANLTVLGNTSGTNTGDQNLQQVTNLGATTTNPITITVGDVGANGITSYSSQGYGVRGESSENYGVYGISTSTAGVYGTSESGYGVEGYSESGIAVRGSAITGYGIESYSYSGRAISATSDIGTGLYANSEFIGASIYSNGIGLQVNGNGTIAIDVILGNSNKGLVINSGTSSTGNFIELAKNSVNKLTVNQAGELIAQKLIKEGGFDNQFLKADGSVDNNTYLTSADLPSTLDLYATTSPDPVIPGYTALVRNIADSRYNTTAVDVPTPTITGTLASPTFCGAVISDPSILLGNPGVFNFSVIGKIRRTGGSTSSGADFFYSIYKRDTSGVETLIADSAPVAVPANGGIYIEYISIALWNNGIFLSTDRVVLKFYGIQSGTGSGATYEFQFGGADPVRGTAAISSAIIPNIYLKDLADVEKTPALNNEVLYWNDSASLWEHSLVENLVPDASATQKGLVTTGTQTFAGAKTFTGAIGASNLSGTNTGDQDLQSVTTKGASTTNAITVTSSVIAITGNSTEQIGVYGTSVSGTGIAGTSIDDVGAYGSSTNAVGGVFNTVNGANIAQFQTGFDIKATVKADGTFAGTGLNASGQTINTIASFDANKNVVSLSTATYPSLTELALLKGVSGSSVQTQLDGKQATLSSTVNIKSINGNDILGSGNLTITAAPEELAAFRMLANNSAVTAVPTVQVFKDIGEQDYILSPTFTPITGPTNIISNTYKYEQVGSLVTVRVNLIYTTAGSISQVVIPLPADMPTPLAPTGLGAALDILYYGVGMFNTLTTSIATVGRTCLLRRNVTNTGYEFVLTHSTAVSSRVISLTLQYFTE